MPKKRMKDMRVMSGTYSQLLPTSWPPYFKHSFIVRDDQSMVVLYWREKEKVSIKLCMSCSHEDRNGNRSSGKILGGKGRHAAEVKNCCTDRMDLNLDIG